MTSNPNLLTSEEEVSPSVAFGVNQAHWTYMMARSLGTGIDNRNIIDGAEDAVLTAMLHHNRPEIDVKEATSALVSKLIEGLDEVS